MPQAMPHAGNVKVSFSLTIQILFAQIRVAAFHDRFEKTKLGFFVERSHTIRNKSGSRRIAKEKRFEHRLQRLFRMSTSLKAEFCSRLALSRRSHRCSQNTAAQRRGYNGSCL